MTRSIHLRSHARRSKRAKRDREELERAAKLKSDPNHRHWFIGGRCDCGATVDNERRKP